MYYIECDIDKSDCFAELVDIQRKIYTFLKDRRMTNGTAALKVTLK